MVLKRAVCVCCTEADEKLDVAVYPYLRQNCGGAMGNWKYDCLRTFDVIGRQWACTDWKLCNDKCLSVGVIWTRRERGSDEGKGVDGVVMSGS